MPLVVFGLTASSGEAFVRDYSIAPSSLLWKIQAGPAPSAPGGQPQAQPPCAAPLDHPTPTPDIRPRRDGSGTDNGPKERGPNLGDQDNNGLGKEGAPPQTKPRQALPAPQQSPKGAKPPKEADAKAGGPKKPIPGLAVAQPRTAVEREKALSDLYALLATAENATQAETISASIEQLWLTSGSDTINYLMQRALHSADTKDPTLALELLDRVVALMPDYAEGWNRRAYVHYTQNHIDLALGDLRRTLALDPNHFKALDGLVHILKEIGRTKEALAAARKLYDVNPLGEGVKQIIDELSREVDDRGI